MIPGNRDVPFSRIDSLLLVLSSPFYPLFVAGVTSRQFLATFAPRTSQTSFRNTSRWLFNPCSVSRLFKRQYFPCHLVSGTRWLMTRVALRRKIDFTSITVPCNRFKWNVSSLRRRAAIESKLGYRWAIEIYTALEKNVEICFSTFIVDLLV